MKKIAFLVLVLFLCIKSNAHEIHISLMNIEIINDSIEISVRLSTSDLLVAINASESINQHNHDQVISLNSEDLENSIDYIMQCISLKTGNVNLELNYSKSIIEGNNYWFYFSSIQTNTITPLILTNKLLIESFSHQKNLVVVNSIQGENGYEFNAKYATQTILPK